ncbi:hypothetical protein Pfo_024402 [Paulownia fortunei]|nr:hypothetical protein Pfo_024402 [Paulownia fortunei]
MSNLIKLEFIILDISGNNYLACTLDAEIHLDAMNLGEIIKERNEASLQDRAKVMIFLRHYLHEKLKTEYLTTIILPKAHYDWIRLRLQNFKCVTEYNSAMFKFTSQLKLCGESITDEDMLEKIFSTFYVSNMLLQQQYRERGFKKYSKLILCLLVVEQNNELLMKNHQSLPTGSTSFPEVNAAIVNNFGHSRYRGSDRGRGHSHGHGRGHWRRICHTSKHFVDLYQASLKEKGKGVETNIIEHYTPMDFMQLDVVDFFENPNGNFENLNGDRNINMV